MGHLQDMTDKQRLKFQSMQYEAAKEARRGNSFAYLSDGQLQLLFDKGYDYHKFDNDKTEIRSSDICKDIVNSLRKNKAHFARIVVNPCYNIRGFQSYSILKKKRK